MTNDFSDAAARHWDDAGHLYIEKRHANADHLFGLSAECALKAVMVGLGMKMKPKKSEDQCDVPINHLWDEFVTFASNRGGARYEAILGAVANPFMDWDVGQRYHHRRDIVPEAVAMHRSGAEIAKSALDAAILDGVVK